MMGGNSSFFNESESLALDGVGVYFEFCCLPIQNRLLGQGLISKPQERRYNGAIKIKV